MDGKYQLVGKLVKVSMVVGKPLVQRARPDHCQFPISPFTQRFDEACEALSASEGQLDIPSWY